MESHLRQLPGVERLVGSPGLREWEGRLTHPTRVRLAQELITELRERMLKGGASLSEADIEKELALRFDRLLVIGIQKVINATGVVLHTNLGRAPLGSSVLREMAEKLDGYCSLEFDCAHGERGERTSTVERYLRLLCDAPAAVVVNNNAAAVFLIFHALAAGKEVVVSRGELVQIGGGFRIPDILAASGARLVEVGTTNMTHVRDYEQAIGAGTALIAKIHHSNFVVSGHTDSPSHKELAALAAKRQLPFVVDLGSGALRDEGLGEPTVAEVLATGASLVCFSGDKLIGGPQAGIVVGDGSLVEMLHRSPLYRALRLGKTELFLLERTLLGFLRGERNITQDCLVATEQEMRERSERFVANLAPKMNLKLVAGTSVVGGGASPGREIESCILELVTADSERVVRRLLAGRPAVVVRKENKRIFLDLRTVLVSEEAILARCLRETLSDLG